MAWCKYRVIDLKSGQSMEGFPADLSNLIGIPKASVSCYAREGSVYKKRYRFQKISEREDFDKEEFSRQWDEICKIYAELVVGERCIQKSADGKLYAVRKIKS